MKTISFKMIAAVVGVALLSGMAGNAQGAGVITTLHNTGVDSGTDVVLGVNNAVTDNNYSVVSPSAATPTPVVKLSSGGFPIPPYIGDNSLSAWIAPDTNSFHELGLYVWTTTFDLTGVNLNTASIFGRWASDNAGVMKLNGVQVANGGVSSGFTDWTAFSFSLVDGLVQTVNTLTFEVVNNESVAALRVEISGTDDVSNNVPEPASLAMWGLGALVMGAARKRRKNVVSE